MKYFIKTFGCQMNESDSERIASFLEKKNYRSTGKIEDADLIVVNACSVRQTAIDRIFGLKKKFKNLKAKKILTGCMIKPDIPKFKEFFDEVKNIDAFLGKKYLSVKPKCQAQPLAYLPIMTGCNNFCSYCVVPYARGRETSRPMTEIIKEFKGFIAEGHQEIMLLGQNVNSYRYGFATLLKKLNSLPGNFRIKFMTNHPKDMSDDLINSIAGCEKVEKEIHLPVQSGDNEILKKMNRKYTVQEYKKLVAKIRRIIPGIKITTDVIIGFPGETEKQFQNTVKLFREIGFDLAYVNKYSRREGTAAAKFKDDVPWQEKKRRWEIIDKISNKKTLPKIIVVLGPTASGKSTLAVDLALRLGSGRAEIISADSQQIYKEMDIGTGKITEKEMRGIPHHLLNIIAPKKKFSVAEYKDLALKSIEKIKKSGKIPIICGGTGLYIRAVIDDLVIPEVKPDWKLRKELEKKTAEELFAELEKLDSIRSGNIDAKNKRRLIRAIEIIKKTGKPIPVLQNQPKFNVLCLGIKKPLPELKKSIDRRIDLMFKSGLEKEVRDLVKKYGWTMVLENTIGYAEFQNPNPKEKIKTNTVKFAKRQLTWFKKYPGREIHWVKNFKEAEKLKEKFLD
jgi:tRNA-2-methylthio-N6-dimethylallyladenosine synthase